MRYKLYYWPVPFRGNFIRLLLEDNQQSYSEATMEEIVAIKNHSAASQPFPAMAPPFLHDLENDLFINQMPAILMYLAKQLGCLPKDPFAEAVCLKLILDSNDILMEITNLNGSSMWTHENWKEFRQKRLPKWLAIFEAVGAKFGLTEDCGFILDETKVSIADYTVFALWGTMMQCLSSLREDVERHAPAIFQLCNRMAERPNIHGFLDKQNEQLGDIYCGGYIEKSIREMLSLDQRLKPVVK